MGIKNFVVGGLLLIVSAIGIKVYAQSKLTEEKKVERITEKMARKLNLSAVQKAKVFAINLKRSVEHRKAYDTGRKKDNIVQAVHKWENDLKKVLTIEQQNRLKI